MPCQLASSVGSRDDCVDGVVEYRFESRLANLCVTGISNDAGMKPLPINLQITLIHDGLSTHPAKRGLAFATRPSPCWPKPPFRIGQFHWA